MDIVIIKLLKKFFIFLLKTCLTLSKLISHNYKDGQQW